MRTLVPPRRTHRWRAAVRRGVDAGRLLSSQIPPWAGCIIRRRIDAEFVQPLVSAQHYRRRQALACDAGIARTRRRRSQRAAAELPDGDRLQLAASRRDCVRHTDRFGGVGPVDRVGGSSTWTPPRDARVLRPDVRDRHRLRHRHRLLAALRRSPLSARSIPRPATSASSCRSSRRRWPKPSRRAT